LVTNLLGITHSQWLHRCAVLHKRDTHGLKLKDSQQLAEAIQEQFLLGLDGLQAWNRHFITRDQATVNALPADNKQAYQDSETREIDGMQTFMLQGLSALSDPTFFSLLVSPVGRVFSRFSVLG
jgi:hypothetical protein